MFALLALAVGVVPYVDKNKIKVPGIVSFQSNGERHIRCDFCWKFPHIVKQYVSKRPPAIATVKGTRFHSRILTEHLATVYHMECAKACRINSIEVDEPGPMDIAISKASKNQIDRVGKLMIQVYLDAKRLNLTAHSWPSRYIAAEASFAYDSLNQNESIISDGINLQYVNKPSHLNLMTAIAKSHQGNFLQKINECVAISLRIDGSIDFTHMDKIYVLGKLINLDGSSELVFIGISEQTQRQAAGLMLAVKEALKAMVDDPKLFLCKVSSVCTDGTNLNTGQRNSLWVLLEKEVQEAGSNIPLIKIWCSAHRAELAWKDAASSVKEVEKMLSVLLKISSYFHFSAIRTAELKKIAAERNLRLLAIPKIFEIRWSQFTFKLMRSVLVSWEALVLYFKENKKNSDCAGFLRYLTKLETVQLIACLADLLFAFSRFQKNLQSDRLTLISLKSHVSTIGTTLNSMKNANLLGGFESSLATKLTREDDKTYFKSVELQTADVSRRANKCFAEVRKDILNALCDFLVDRFNIDEELFNKIQPFVNFSNDADLKEIHTLLAPDVSLPSLHLQFTDWSNGPASATMKDLSLGEIILKLSKTSESRNLYKELITVLARIAACTPHSADVERCVSANNLLKTKLRSCISLETENKYLYIHMNMPDLSQWNPTAAAKLFVNEKIRRHRDITPANESTRGQAVYKGVFPEAAASSDGNEDDEEEADDVRDTIFDF